MSPLDQLDRPLAALEELRMLTDAVPVLISFFDENLVCRFANAHHNRWYGRSPQELIGLPMSEFLPPEIYAKRLPYLARVAAGEQVSFDAPVPHRDGTLHDAAIRYVPKMGPRGFAGFYTLVFDVAVQQHRFRSVFDGNAVAFWEIDVSGVTALLMAEVERGVTDPIAQLATDPLRIRAAMDAVRIIDVNDKAASLFGVDRDAVAGRSVSRFWPPASETAFVGSVAASFQGDATYEVETVLLRADGRLVDVLFTCAFPRDAGPAHYVTVGFVDISERVAKERALAKVQADLAHAARVATLGELTASIAHEVNQPLAAVAANGNAALRWLNRPVPDIGEVKAAIDRIIEEATRASEIIARTRALAMKGETERQVFCPNTMVHDAVALVRRQLDAGGVELRLELADDLPPINADRIQLQQVTINLMINAAQAMADQPAGTRQLTVASRHEGDAVLFEVADTGPGFPGCDSSKLFGAFYTTKPTGMGMGLSVARTIVEAHGGVIDAYCLGEGTGAAFRFTVPAHDGDDCPNHTQV
ncbi:PAS domain-containing protein [Sphingoaurantiacus capsulatus]|uniref:histidine kinase n=1 Tax=Sphingoaurantiacus capsulatus TaxID=1771310 RepID=A0ABV7XAI8_9SPHN